MTNRRGPLESIFLGALARNEDSPTFSYQRRLNSFVTRASLLVQATIGLVVWYCGQLNLGVALAIGIVALSVLVQAAIGDASDAIFDSLWERINQQSIYLDARFRILEAALNVRIPNSSEPFAKEHMINQYSDLGPILHEAFGDYPERRWERWYKKRLEELRAARTRQSDA